jgi:predicted transcriptional regulator
VLLPDISRTFDLTGNSHLMRRLPIGNEMNAWKPLTRLKPRERQVAEAVYSLGIASANQVCNALPVAISNSAVRTMLRRLEQKGMVRKQKEGCKFLYAPALLDETQREAALRRLSDEYFGGSLSEIAALLSALARRDQQPALPPDRDGGAG